MARSKADMPPSQRKKLAQQGKALSTDGSGKFPITNEDDLKRAIQAIGRAKPGDRARIKAYIKRRARALGLTRLIPESWS